MGSRRLGRQRLYALDKLGQDSDMTEGAGVNSAIGHSRLFKDGTQVTTEIYVDLGTSLGTMASSGSAGAVVIGLSGSQSEEAGPVGPAFLCQLSDTVNGMIHDVELTCVENVAGGEPDIDVVYSDSATLRFASPTGSAGATTAVLVAAGTDLVKGDNSTGTVDNNAASGKYLYLATGQGAGDPDDADYTAGKLVLRLYGTLVPDDV
jgi:hypothetical protein